MGNDEGEMGVGDTGSGRSQFMNAFLIFNYIDGRPALGVCRGPRHGECYQVALSLLCFNSRPVAIRLPGGIVREEVEKYGSGCKNIRVRAHVFLPGMCMILLCRDASYSRSLMIQHQ